MNALLFKIGTSFLRAFGAAVIVYATGILAAPNLHVAVALSIAALLGALAAGFRTVQVFVPQITFSTLLGQPYGAWVDAFVRAFLATLIVSVTGWLASPDFSTWRSVGIGAVVGAGTAGFRALQGLLTAGDQPAPATGG